MRLHNTDIQGASAVTHDVVADFVHTLKRIVPLWRVGVVGMAVLALVVACLTVRMMNGATTSEIRSYAARASEAATAHDQLQLEVAIRHGNDNLQRAALAYGLTVPAHVERVRLEGGDR